MKLRPMPGIISGIAGGAAGAAAMEIFQLLLRRFSKSGKAWVDECKDGTHHPPTGERRRQEKQARHRQPSTATTADAASVTLSSLGLSWLSL